VFARARSGRHHAVKLIGLPDHFVEHGAIPILRGLCGMDAPGIVSAAGELLGHDLRRSAARSAAAAAATR
jgi:hypothetical protein